MSDTYQLKFGKSLSQTPKFLPWIGPYLFNSAKSYKIIKLDK